MGFSSPSARSLAACPRGFENRGQQRNILGKLCCRENPVRVSKLSSQWALWGLGCDSGHAASLSCLFSLPVPGKKQMGISASLLVARSELVLGIPRPIPACPLAQVWVVLQGDVLGFVHRVHSLCFWHGCAPLGLYHFPLCREDVKLGWRSGWVITQPSSSSCPSQARSYVVAGTLGPS